MRFLSALAGFAALSSLVSANPHATFKEDPQAIRIPLIQRRSENITNTDGSVNFGLLDQELQATVVKYTRRVAKLKAAGFQVPGLLARELADDDAPAQNSEKMLKVRGTNTLYFDSPYSNKSFVVKTYSVAMRIGTPNQVFNLLLDTGSTDLIVADSTCTNCAGKRLYQNRTSSTFTDYKTQVSSSFGTGTTGTGTITGDTFLVAQSRINNQTFLRAQTLNSGLVTAAVDGIMGMAYPALSNAGATSIPFTARAQGNGDYFMIRLSNRQGFSELSLGAIDSARVGSKTLTFAVLKDTTQDGSQVNTFWQIGSSTPNVNGKAVLTTRATFILDSGSGLIIGPPKDVQSFYAAIPGSAKLPNSANYYTYPCAQQPTVSFSFGARTASTNNFAMAPADFNLGTTDAAGTTCVGAVVTANLGLGARWLVGASFMKSWSIIHDMSKNQITIASPVDTGAKGTPGGKKF